MSEEHLLKDFSAVSLEQWKQQIIKDLKGKDYETLQNHTADGVSIDSVYHRSNSAVNSQPFKENASWTIVQEILVEDEKTANKQALEHLNRGATSLLFFLYSNADLNVLLQDIQLEHIRTNFVVEGEVLTLTQNLKQLLIERQIDGSQINGSINIDCLESIARTGEWKVDEEADFNTIKELLEESPIGLKSLCINTNLFGNSGATLSQQLGVSLAMVYEYIFRLDIKNTDKFWINFAIGSDYFGELAKLRTFRRLWDQLHTELGMESKEVFIYTETALRNKTIMDPHNNMIRTTSEAMSAIIGGANEISVKGFNHTYKEPDFFGERVAKNQQNILEHESHLSKVNDLSKGSYYIEFLSNELADKAWTFFKAIEKHGGYVQSLRSGWLQSQIEASAQAEQQRFDEGQQVLIGANKHAKQDEDIKEIIEFGMFTSKDFESTTFKRIRPIRLSEKLENQD